MTDPVPIAIVPFARAVPADGGLDVAEVVQHDLEGSGRFKALAARATCRRRRRAAEDVQLRRLEGGRQRLRRRRARRAPSMPATLAVDFDLVNTLTGQQASRRSASSARRARCAMPRIASSDVIYEKIIGIRGAFATRIAYVAVDGQPPAQQLSTHRRGRGRREPAAGPRVALPAHVAGLVAGRAVARLRVVREPSAPRSTCSWCAPASGARCRRAPASTARRRGRRTARSWRSRWAAAAAIPTSTCSIWPRRS